MSRGEVYRFNLELCVVVMHDPSGNSPVSIVCPLTDAGGRPGNLLNPAVAAGTGGTTKDSRVACHQVRTLDKRRVVGSKVGELPAPIMAAVSEGLKAVLGL